MKRFLAVLLVAAFLCSIMVSCKGGNGDGDITTVPALDYSISTWISYSTDKQMGDGEVPEKKNTSVDVYMGKNESESVQISFRSDKKLDSMTVLASGDLDGITVSYFTVETVTVKGNKWPDPLIPFDSTFTVPKNANKSILIRFDTDKNTVAGNRTVTLTVKDKDGNKISDYTVNIKIWNFEYADAPIMDSFTLIYKSSIATHHETSDQAEIDRLYKLYYDLLLDYKISGGELPYDILDNRADAYMSDPRVTTFMVPHEGVDDATLVANYNKIKSNSEWLKKACIYVSDEPNDMDKVRTFEQTVARLERLCPDIKIFVTFYNDFMYDDTRDVVQYFMDTVDIIAASFACFDDGFLYKTNDVKGKFPTLKNRTDAYKQLGNKVWTYVGWDPGPEDGYTNILLNEKGIDHRVLFWQQYDYGSQGFLYWAANYWEMTGNPWTNMATFTMLGKTVYGDGSLLYNGNRVGVDGACPSLRLEIVKDGIEDFALLSMAAEKLSEDEFEDIMNKVSRSLTLHTGSSEIFYKARKELGNAIEAALGQ